MFTGGGLAWAETQMKAGAFAVAPAPAGTRPDLTGLSCRFAEIESEWAERYGEERIADIRACAEEIAEGYRLTGATASPS